MTKLSPPQTTGRGIFSRLASQPYLLLTLAPLFWGGNITFGRMAVGEIDPYMLSVLRWAGALALVLPFGIAPMRREWPTIRRNLALLALYGGLGFTTFNMLIYAATHFTTGVNASMEQALIPVIVMIGNFVIFREHSRTLQIVGVALTIVGVAMVATHGNPARILSLDVNIGDGMVILACLSYATYSITLRYKPAIHWLSFICVCAFFALITAVVYQLAFGGGIGVVGEKVAAVTGLGWLIVLYVAVLPSIVSQLCYARGVEMIGPNRGSLFINLLPVFGAVLSVLLLGEGLELYHFGAAFLIVGGIVLAEYAVRRARSARTTG